MERSAEPRGETVTDKLLLVLVTTYCCSLGERDRAPRVGWLAPSFSARAAGWLTLLAGGSRGWAVGVARSSVVAPPLRVSPRSSVGRRVCGCGWGACGFVRAPASLWRRAYATLASSRAARFCWVGAVPFVSGLRLGRPPLCRFRLPSCRCLPPCGFVRHL